MQSMNEPPLDCAEGRLPSGDGPYIHVDTTLQIEQLKTPLRAEVVKRALAEYKFRSTSTYARFEFNRTLLRDLAYLYVRAQKARGLGDILGEINKAFTSRMASRNRLARCLEVIQHFLDIRPGNLTPDLELLRFREFLVYGMTQAHVAWGRSVHHEFNGTQCARAEERPMRAANDNIIFSLPRCRPSKINCQIHHFYSSNSGRFKTLGDKIKALGDGASAQMKRAAEVLNSAAENPKQLCDDRICAKIGDLLIAVDGLDLPRYGANNDEDWRPISEALGKLLVNPLRVPRRGEE
ncbi:MAG TPA: hypothetical protein VFE47_25660 [Tepidisphaeraceae bacterium]|jgi:hypothetical protein|nr:hypothetical protein [Tepidisphaeraceae bacterium]